MVIPEDHVLRGWFVVHAGWLLNRFHVTSTNGVTAFMALRGRPYRERVCAFGEVVYALGPVCNRNTSVSGAEAVG